ncbi:alanine racemase [Nonomuraea sp. NPDC003727]
MYPEIDTPALVIDLDVVGANITEMAKVAARNGVRLRPHVKTHKMPELARRQLEAGATGITCAKLGEAEIMAEAGIDDILLAFPIWGEPKLRRLAALRERVRVRVSLDSPEVAAGLGRLGGPPVEVLVEVDTGQHRLGRPPGRPTADLVAEIAAVPGVEVVGLLTLAGHAYHARTAEELATTARREGEDLVATAALCARDGIELREISVGSTPPPGRGGDGRDRDQAGHLHLQRRLDGAPGRGDRGDHGRPRAGHRHRQAHPGAGGVRPRPRLLRRQPLRRRPRRRGWTRHHRTTRRRSRRGALKEGMPCADWPASGC